MHCHCFHLLLSLDVDNGEDLFYRYRFVFLTAPLPSFFLPKIELTDRRRPIVVDTDVTELVIGVEEFTEILQNGCLVGALVEKCYITLTKHALMMLFKGVGAIQ
jgi:hypothetical protein